MFDLMNMITGYQTNYLEKLLGVVVSSQQFISEHITQCLTSFTEVTISTQQNIAEYTRNYFDVLSDTYIKPNDYTLGQAKFYYNSAIDYNNQITNMMNHYIDDLVHPMLQQTTDITTYTYNNLVLPAVENTSNCILAFISLSENYLADFSKLQLFCLLLLFFLFFGMQRNVLLTRNMQQDMNVYRSLMNKSLWQNDTLLIEVEELNRRLNRNKEKRIPKTVSRIENLYTLMDKSYGKKTLLFDELNYWSPVIMAQENKLRMANQAMKSNDENGNVEEIRNLGHHVDLDLIRMKDQLDKMTTGVQREMRITSSLYDGQDATHEQDIYKLQ